METDDIDALIDRHRDRFRRLVRDIVEEEGAASPFRLPLDVFLALPDDERAAVVLRAGELARDRVERELRARAATWVVLVGGDVVASSADRPALPAPDDVIALGRGRNLVPFLFEAPLIEEIAARSPWSAVTTGLPGDTYPTIPVRLDDRDVVADLDTGAHSTFVDAALVPVDRRSPMWFIGVHFGQQFAWSAASVEATVALSDGRVRSVSFPVRVVRGWRSSPFVRLNPTRIALVGRDLLRALGLRVLLDAVAGETTIP